MMIYNLSRCPVPIFLTSQFQSIKVVQVTLTVLTLPPFIHPGTPGENVISSPKASQGLQTEVILVSIWTRNNTDMYIIV